jgi:hypothetical protein
MKFRARTSAPGLTRCYFALSLLLAGCGKTTQERWVSPATGVSFQVPGSAEWKPLTGRSEIQKLAFARKDSRAMLVYDEVPENFAPKLDDKFALVWEQRHQRVAKASKVAGQYVTITPRGYRMYKYEEQQPQANGPDLHAITFVGCCGSNVFHIIATAAHEDPMTEEFIQKFVDSIEIPAAAQASF